MNRDDELELKKMTCGTVQFDGNKTWRVKLMFITWFESGRSFNGKKTCYGLEIYVEYFSSSTISQILRAVFFFGGGVRGY